MKYFLTISLIMILNLVNINSYGISPLRKSNQPALIYNLTIRDTVRYLKQESKIDSLETVIATLRSISPESDSIVQKIETDVNDFFNLINWQFVGVYVLIIWLIISYSFAKNSAKWLDWIQKIPTGVILIIIGIILILIFMWVFNYTTKMEIFQLFISFLFSGFLYKIGIDRVLKWVAKNMLKLDLN